MRNLKTIENRVLAVLKEHPEARNDDMKLYLLISKACIYDTHGISPVSYTHLISWLTQSLHSFSFGKPSSASVMKTLIRSAQAEKTLFWNRSAPITPCMTRL